ncbi:DUF3465 domain-containing protein [Hydrogenimonas sp.]
MRYKKAMALLATFLAALLAALYPQLAPDGQNVAPRGVVQPESRLLPVEVAQARHLSNVWVEGEGVVLKLLPDDTKGSRHQRILLRLKNGRTLLIVHNIDLAPRIGGLKKGERVRFVGEFVDNDKGGLVHWTHHDPSGRHPGGWLEYRGRRYR